MKYNYAVGAPQNIKQLDDGSQENPSMVYYYG
jgi:hypothetical protein